MQKTKRINSKKSLYIIGSILILSSISIMVYKYYQKSINIQNEIKAI